MIKSLSEWYYQELKNERLGVKNDSLILNSTHNEAWECSKCGAHGLILPTIPFELCWNIYLRAVLYLFGLIYIFLGVAIVSDIFMASIEKITSKTKRAFVKFEYQGKIQYKVYDDKIWNDTVANLTLMALGSSAPEILLSCIEIVGNTFESGPLGAGTIVGSAAFNLLCIIGVCIISVPKGEVRKIKGVKVFVVTSIFSLFAYFWMIVVLEWCSKGVVEVWEAVLTLLLFPLLVFVSWWADHNFCLRERRARRWSSLATDEEHYEEGGVPFHEHNPLYKDGLVDQEALIKLYSQWRAINPTLTEEETASLIARKLIDDTAHSHLWYRSGVTRTLMGGPQLVPVINEKLVEVYHVVNKDKETPLGIARKDSDPKKAIIEFQGSSVAVMENVGNINVKLIRRGRLDNEVSVRLETIDGTATAVTDYIAFNYVITFVPNSTEIDVPITIVDDKQWEPEEEFFIRASIANDNRDAVLGKIPIMEIIILDDDNPGSLSFTQRVLTAKPDCGSAEIHLKRSSGCDGVVSVSYKTIDGTAQCPDEYTETKGKIEFKHGQTTADISVPIINSENSRKNAYFFVVLHDPAGGLHLGDVPKIKVNISVDEVSADTIEKMMLLAAENVESMQMGHGNYSSQFKDALTVNGGDIEEATRTDYFLHVVSFPWKVLFACLPPVRYCGGWLCFIASLLAIGILTAIVGDMAEAFGCLIDLRDTVTAITFVALGTSVPDLFASKLATVNEKYADNAIGNVTGSNSVNVFLGLGLPWTLATVYHAIKGTNFKVPAGDLVFSVGVYSGFALICLLLLFIRRMTTKAELGGNTASKWACGLFLFLCWIMYVVLSSLVSYEILETK